MDNLHRATSWGFVLAINVGHVSRNGFEIRARNRMDVADMVFPILSLAKFETTHLHEISCECESIRRKLHKYFLHTWQWWKSLRSWLLRCQRRFFLSPKVRWHLLHLKGRSLLWTTFMWRSKSPRLVKRASHKSHAWGRSWACVFRWAFSEPGFMIRWQERHSILAPSPSPTTMVRTWIRPSPSSSYSSKSSAFYKNTQH